MKNAKKKDKEPQKIGISQANKIKYLFKNLSNNRGEHGNPDHIAKA